jgi:hypothetical protein
MKPSPYGSPWQALGAFLLTLFSLVLVFVTICVLTGCVSNTTLRARWIQHCALQKPLSECAQDALTLYPVEK